MPTLSPRERIVVGAGAAVALLVGGYLLVVEPLMARARTAETTVPVREEILERRREQVRQQARLTEELAAVNARLAAEAGRMLSGPTAPLAASELQQMVKDLLAEAGVEIRSERVLPPADQHGLQEVAIEMAIMGSIRDTVVALTRLERTSRLLALKDVKMRVVAVGQPRELLTTLVVAGYVMPGAPALRTTSARSD
jgi:general secretion pathway protein M